MLPEIEGICGDGQLEGRGVNESPSGRRRWGWRAQNRDLRVLMGVAGLGLNEYGGILGVVKVR